jgi:hypothetical protein
MSVSRLAIWSVTLGGVLAVIGAFPAAALIALAHHFPVPFFGDVSGPQGVPASLSAVLFFEIIGGFPFLLTLGAIGGLIAYWIGKPNKKKTYWLSWGIAILIDVLAALIVAVMPM